MEKPQTVPRAGRSQEEDRAEGEEGSGEGLSTYAVIPPNGGWGWLVVVCAFYCNVVVDGIQLTFGVFLSAISKSFQAEVAEVALAGSLMFGVHLLMGPVCAAFSKVFGLRPVTIAGSLICCFGVGISYFATGYWFLYISFGVVGGIGLGLVYMNSLVITSVYFTTLLPLAVAVVVCGTGAGTMIFAALGQHLLEVTTWQNSFLIQAALAGSMAFAAATFRPLKPVKVQVLPAPSPERDLDSRKSSSSGPEEPSERRKTVFVKTNPSGGRSGTSLITVHTAIWNFAEEAVVSDRRPCPSKCWGCRKRRKKSTKGEVLVLSEVRSEAPRRSYVEQGVIHESSGEAVPREGVYVPEASGPGPRRAVFRRMVVRSGNRGCDAIKRTMKAMLDCHLMGHFTFVVFTMSGAFQMAGFLIVFIYEKERCLTLGFSEDMSVYFVIFLGGANMIWRLFLGAIASLPKVNYWALAITGIVLGGVATIFSGFHTSVYYQFGFCFFFGLGIASFAVFRIILLVDLVGTASIENATGINLLFMGILCIISPPFFGWLMELTNSYNVVFITTGIFIVVSGLMLIGLNKKKVEK